MLEVSQLLVQISNTTSWLYNIINNESAAVRVDPTGTKLILSKHELCTISLPATSTI